MSDIINLSVSQKFLGTDKDYLLLSLENKLYVNSSKRLYLLLDVSGSMYGERINLVIHACKAIILSSDESIEISIYTFSSRCIQITELLKMTIENKNKLIALLSQIDTNGSTNLIDGLNVILNYIKNVHNPTLIDTHCIVFTDGEPDDKIIDNYYNLLYSYFRDSQINCIIDVFGFGNSLSIDILKSIYSIGKGIFAFISDINMMATIFNNYLANLLSTSITNLQFSYEIVTKDDDIQLNMLYIGNIQSGQIKYYLIEIPKESNLGFSRLSMSNLFTNKNESIMFDSIPLININNSMFILNRIRKSLIEILSEITEKNILNLSIINSKLDIIYNNYNDILLTLDHDVFANDIKILLNDIKSNDPNKGQIQKAITDSSYNKWGKYYIISLYQAHFNQTTINFKDQSIEKYSGILAKNNLSRLDTIFNSIQYVQIASYNNYGGGNSNPTPVAASNFNNRYAGCFDENSFVKTYNNSELKYVKLKDLKHGDIIYNETSIIIVQYILKTKYINQIMYKFNDLIGTSTHPIYDNDWIHLMNLSKSYIIENYSGNYLYSISAIEILPDRTFKNVSSILINDVKCATFGHGDLDKNENDINHTILSSTFWGSTILSIFHKLHCYGLLNNNVLTLENNYGFIRNNNGWCIGLELNGIEYF